MNAGRIGADSDRHVITLFNSLGDVDVEDERANRRSTLSVQLLEGELETPAEILSA